MLKHHTVLIVCDINTKTGKEEYLKDVTGKETLHEKSSDNSKRICNLALVTMFLVSPKFRQREEHKIMWTLPMQV